MSGPSAAIGPPSSPLNTACSFAACSSEALASMTVPSRQLPSVMTLGVSTMTTTASPLDVGALDVAVGDVEDERRAAAVVVGAVGQIEIARTKEVARTGFDVRPPKFPRHSRIVRRTQATGGFCAKRSPASGSGLNDLPIRAPCRPEGFIVGESVVPTGPRISVGGVGWRQDHAEPAVCDCARALGFATDAVRRSPRPPNLPSTSKSRSCSPMWCGRWISPTP